MRDTQEIDYLEGVPQEERTPEMLRDAIMRIHEKNINPLKNEMPQEQQVQWSRSSSGFCESKCGRFGISPEYWGRCEPQSYTLTDRESGKEYRLLDTQKKAKHRANQILSPPPPQPRIEISDDLF